MPINNAMRVDGVETVLGNLNKEVMKIKFRTRKGMISAGFLIQREAQKLTPVEFGNLKASAFTVWGPGTGGASAGFSGPDASELASDHALVKAQEGASLPTGFNNPSVAVGFSASYAIYVHENTMASHIKSKRGETGPRGGKMVGGKLLKAVVTDAVSASSVTQIGEAKFLEKAVDRNRLRILETIANEGQV